MAKFIKFWKSFRETFLGNIVLAIIYAAMLIIVLTFFTGEGQFIYEGF